MLESDYLLQMILSLAKAIVHTIEDGDGDDDPQGSADMIESLIGQAAPIDGAMLLGLSPESMAQILKASGPEDMNVEFIGRSLYLEASYLHDAGNEEVALIRLQQARKLADEFGFDLHEDEGAASALIEYERRVQKAVGSQRTTGAES